MACIDLNFESSSDLLRIDVVSRNTWWLCDVAAWHCILCILCDKTFSSMRHYQLHHKHSHLMLFDHECQACGLCFVSNHSLRTHHCVPLRRCVNVKKRQVIAARMHEKMQLTSEPYFVFVDSDNQLMAYAGDKDQSDPTAETDPNNPGIDHTNESDFIQTDPFQLTDNSAVLSCLPQCDGVLTTMETLSTELEMDACDTLELQGSDAVMQQSDAGEHLLTIANEKIPTGADKQDGEPAKSSDINRTQQWPMATSLGEGRLQCNVCHKELRIANYYPHMRRVHKIPSSQSRPIAWKVCDRCGYKCQDNYKMRRHSMKHTQYGTNQLLWGQTGAVDPSRSSQQGGAKHPHTKYFVTY